MTITTQTYWDIDGVPLNTYAYNITTLGSGRTNVPLFRGGNIVVPYRRGEVFVPKVPASRQITLAMWVLGADEDGKTSDAVESTWQDNLDMLRRLMWREGQFTLTKRFWRDGSIVSASAQVEFARGLEPSMQAVGLSRMSVVFNLADPFFYGDQVVEEFEDETKTISVEGDVTTHKIEIDMGVGSEITNTEFTPNLVLKSNVAATVDVQEKTVEGMSAHALVEYSGSDFWFQLKPGDNEIQCSGSATLRYYPAYF